MDEKSWDEFRENLEEELEQARKEMRLANSFDEMEEIALAVGDKLHEKLLVAGIEEREKQRESKCPKCGGKLKKRERRHVKSRRAEGR